MSAFLKRFSYRQWLLVPRVAGGDAASGVDPLLPVARGSYREIKCLTFPDKVYKVSENSTPSE
jgi:hypothetical protein